MAHTFDVDKYKETHLVNIILTVPKRKLRSHRGIHSRDHSRLVPL